MASLGEADGIAETDEEALIAQNKVLLETQASGRAISQLVLFSCVLFTIPLALMYLSYRFLFIGDFWNYFY